MRLAPGITDLIENSSVQYHAPDHREHKFAGDGFENYRGRVRIDDVIFDYVVMVGQNGNKNMFYDISLEVEPTLPSANARQRYKNGSTSADSIALSVEGVNNKFSLRKTTAEDLFKPQSVDKGKLNDQIDHWLRGEMKPEEVFELGDTPFVMEKLGAKKLSVILSQRVIAKIAGGKHDIPLDAIRNLPELINDPVMIFKSNTVDNAFIMFVDDVDKSGRPIMAALHINRTEGRYRVNRVASVYGRSNYDNFIESQIRSGNLKYVNDLHINKSQQRSTSGRLQLPKLVQSVADNNSILRKSDFVNRENVKNSVKTGLGMTYEQARKYGRNAMALYRETNNKYGYSSFIENQVKLGNLRYINDLYANKKTGTAATRGAPITQAGRHRTC